MNQSVQCPSAEFLQSISNIFHPIGDGSFYINHNCFNVKNHIVVPYQIYLLVDYLEDSISNIAPFKLEDILIFDNFIMIVGIDMLTGEEEGRNEYLIDNKGCAFKLVDFDFLKSVMNKKEVKP
jgi:virulence-associated protein VapD